VCLKAGKRDLSGLSELSSNLWTALCVGWNSMIYIKKLRVRPKKSQRTITAKYTGELTSVHSPAVQHVRGPAGGHAQLLGSHLRLSGADCMQRSGRDALPLHENYSAHNLLSHSFALLNTSYSSRWRRSSINPRLTTILRG
jgi:hypothetical protein